MLRRKAGFLAMGANVVALVFVLLQLSAFTSVAQNSTIKWQTLNGSLPLVIARGGFSGLFPDSSSTAYSMALITSAPDSVLWCDVQLTSDGFGICFPNIMLNNASNVERVYPKQDSSYIVDGVKKDGYFSVDFTLDELRLVFLTQGIYSRPSTFDGFGVILTVEDVYTEARPAGFWLNIQHNAFYSERNLSMSSYLISAAENVNISHISSPEIAFLRQLATPFAMTQTKLIFRFLEQDAIEISTNQTYGSLLKNITFIQSFASGILVPKSYIWPVDETSYLLPHTSLVQDAHLNGLEVFASDFANDNSIPYNYSFNPIAEYLSFIDNKEFSVDGVLTDFPMTLTGARANPLVISHFGASGDYPGCTDISYTAAISDGADVIDCPVQMSKDGVPFCLSSANLMNSTLVTQTEFRNLLTTADEIQSNQGIFSFSLNWADIQNLKPVISNPYAGSLLFRNPKFRNAGKLISLAEFLDLAKNASSLSGVLIKIENARYLATNQSMSVTDAVLSALEKAGYNDPTAKKVMIQSTSSAVLKAMKGKNYTLVYEVDETIRGAPNATIIDIKTFAESVVVNKKSVFTTLLGYITKNRCLTKPRPFYMSPVQPGAILALVPSEALPPAQAPSPLLNQDDISESPLPAVVKVDSPPPTSTPEPPKPSASGQHQITASTLVIFSDVLGQSLTKIFNVKDYGAVDGGKVDISQAMLKTWNAACNWKGKSRLEISPGTTYLLNPIILKGPCFGPTAFRNSGTLKAPKGLRGLYWIEFRYINNFALHGIGYFDGQGPPLRAQPNLPALLRFTFVTNARVQKIKLINSQSTHFHIFGCNQVTISRITISSPGDSPNTDGVKIGASTGIRLLDSNIASGDDCVAILRGSKNITVTGVTCGPGHGISIGSMGTMPNEEVEQIVVRRCKIFDATNGLRIKTWATNMPGRVTNVLYEDITLRNVDNPIIIEQNYCPSRTCSKGNSRVQISDIKYRNIQGTSTTGVAVNLQCSGSNPCQRIELKDINIKYVKGGGRTVSTCSYVNGQALGQRDIKVFNLKDYGAVEGGNVDISQALLRAWDDACKWNGRSKLEVSVGSTYMVNPVQLKGPCAGPTGFHNMGTLKAPRGLRGLSWIEFLYVDRLAVYGTGIFDGQGPPQQAGPNLPTLLRYSFVTNSKLQKVKLLNSLSTHFHLFKCKQINIRKLTISSPGDSPNTDGIKIGVSEDISITDTNIASGDDCVAIITGSKNITVTRVSCGPGHGISIGSLGTSPKDSVEKVVVKDCKIFDAMNGLRIKTWATNMPGMVNNILFDGISLTNVDNPIIIDQNYCPSRTCSQGNSHVQISNVKFSNIKGTSQTTDAVNLQCSGSNPCQSIDFENINIQYSKGINSTVSTCSNVKGQAFGVQVPKSCVS
ncbi:hypothetical protein KSS87_021287 [Heliosperma pusillum]|nr:hypothetical protein KSS87_021287 [Heliosperma pusillum]